MNVTQHNTDMGQNLTGQILKPLNLGIITDSLSPSAGGLFESVRLPANKLANRGARVTVYGVRNSSFEASRSSWQGPSVEAFAHIGPRQLAMSPDMLRRVLGAEHDVLHLHGVWQFPSFVTLRWRKRTGRPTIVSPRGMLDPWALRRSSLRKALVRTFYEDANLQGATAIHALNASEAASIRAFGLTNPIAIIPNGVDLIAPGPLPPMPDYMVGDERKVLLFLGRLHPKKGIRELITAWVRLQTLSSHVAKGWRLVIAGWDDGGLGEALKSEVAANQFNGHVTFTGALHGVVKTAALAHASAFVLPSRSEGMPMAILEAWSHRLPVFMTKECNLAAAFKSNAAIEIMTDPEAMAATFAECLQNTERLRRIGILGHDFVERAFTWDRVVADMIRLYSWAITGGTRPEFIV